MEIDFAKNKLRKQCTDTTLMTKAFGAERAKRLRRRLDDLYAAPSLETMQTLPGRCHELTGDRAGQLSVDLDGPYRLVFEPAHNPVPEKPDGGMDWRQITAVRVLAIEDTHE